MSEDKKEEPRPPRSRLSQLSPNNDVSEDKEEEPRLTPPQQQHANGDSAMTGVASLMESREDFTFPRWEDLASQHRQPPSIRTTKKRVILWGAAGVIVLAVILVWRVLL